jgi:hypothetical protein
LCILTLAIGLAIACGILSVRLAQTEAELEKVRGWHDEARMQADGEEIRRHAVEREARALREFLMIQHDAQPKP